MDSFFPKLDLTSLTRTKAVLSKEFHTSIIDFDDMFFYEFNILIEQVEESREAERLQQLEKYGLVG